jgi:DNA-binding CsgD family transcriptional regulator
VEFLSKRASWDIAIDAIRRVAGEDLPAPIKETELGEGEFELVETMARRSVEYLVYLGQGHKPREIARIMQISVKTVDSYAEIAKRRLSLGNYRELRTFATKWVKVKYPTLCQSRHVDVMDSPNRSSERDLRRSLSPRKLHILTRLTQGASSMKIAEELGISPSTVDSHIEATKRLAGVQHRDELLERFKRGHATVDANSSPSQPNENATEAHS